MSCAPMQRLDKPPANNFRRGLALRWTFAAEGASGGAEPFPPYLALQQAASLVGLGLQARMQIAYMGATANLMFANDISLYSTHTAICIAGANQAGWWQGDKCPLTKQIVLVTDR